MNISELFNSAAMALQNGELKTAERQFHKLLRLTRNQPGSALHGLGLVRASTGDYKSAEALLKDALVVEPENPSILCDLGTLFYDRGEPARALDFFDRAVLLNPSSSLALSNRSGVLLRLGQNDRALADAYAAVKLDSDNAAGHIHMGNALRELGDLVGALEAQSRALKLSPNNVVAIINRADIMFLIGSRDEAHQELLNAFRMYPEDAEVEFNLAASFLRLGNFSDGWRHYEARFRFKREFGYSQSNLPLKSRPNSPKSLHGRSVVVFSEQGLGDTIQFSRYLRFFCEIDVQVTFLCQVSLKRLLEGALGRGVKVEDHNHRPRKAHYYIPLMSLPLFFGPDFEIPPPVFQGPVEGFPEGTQRFSADSLKVGLVWRGSRENSNDVNRSAPLDVFDSILSLNLSFYPLQVDPSPKELAYLATFPSVKFSPHFGDFLDTAQFVSKLNLVIAVDTSVAHLTASLGIETWLLLPVLPDFRWQWDRQDSPWYPSLKVFRQNKYRDWSSVMATLRAELVKAFPMIKIDLINERKS